MNSSSYAEISSNKPSENIETHVPLVKKVARHLINRFPPSIQIEDLMQAGMIGLMEAMKNYDAEKGASFQTYAGIRIRGAMLDEVRRCDWIPRSVHKNSRRVSEAVNKIEHLTGRDAKDTEIAEYLSISLDEYYKIQRDSFNGKVLAFEELGFAEDSFSINIPSESEHDPFYGLQNELFSKSLQKNIKSLSEREQLILSLYYEKEMNLREIGEKLGITESRVCQIHAQVMHRLQGKMQEWNKN